MSSREEENAAAAREGSRNGACPFCWGYNIVYNEHYKTWRCNKCERSFPVPSYGPGGQVKVKVPEPLGFQTAVFTICPACNQRTLLFHGADKALESEFFECQNDNCRRVFRTY